MLGKQIGSYKIDLNQRLGKGAFGDVYYGFDLKNGLIIAVKQIAICQKNQKEQDRTISNEIAIMKSISDPNVVKLFDVQRTQNNTYLVMEYCNQGTLEQYIAKKNNKQGPKYLAESEVLLIMKQLVSGFQTLYKNKIVHRDLKLQNILMHDGSVKIADFGFSKVLESGMEDQLLKTYAGSPLYMSIQILKSQQYSSKCDIWSLGVIFFELLYGTTPWQAQWLTELIMQIEATPLRFPPRPIVSDETKQLISQMLQKEEQNRISWEEIFKHRFFNNDMELEQENNLKQHYKEINKQPDNLRRSNAKKNLYFVEQGIVQNLQHAQQVQEKIQHALPNMMEQEEQPQQIKQAEVQQQLDADQIYMKQRQELVSKKVIQNISDWIIHRKNKSVFLNNLSQQWFDLYDSHLKQCVDISIYYPFLFLLTKYQTLILFKMLCRISTKELNKEHTKFMKDQWMLFCKSKEYGTSLKTIKNDFTVIKSFLQELIPRTQQILQINKEQNEQLLSICNLEVVQKKLFDPLFKIQVRKVLDVIIKNFGDQAPISIRIFIKHLQNALIMDTIFKFRGPQQVDFFKYYENIQNEL